MKEKLTETSIRQGLATSCIGQRIIYKLKIPSTMEIAKKEALRGALEGTVVVADEQTAGKGRIGRLWSSPKGCIALSIILYPKSKNLSSLIMIASLAVMYTIKSVTGLKSKIKWPNDILINEKKVSGILIESGNGENNSHYAIIGIGINANFEAGCLNDVALNATSLSDELGSKVSRLKIIRKLICEIERLNILAQQSELVFQEWQRNLETIGKQVIGKSGNKTYEGIAESVEKDGSLMLRLKDNSLKRFIAGDIILYK